MIFLFVCLIRCSGEPYDNIHEFFDEIEKIRAFVDRVRLSDS